ncbi:MAG TPA: hypothetical protein DCM28_17415 [Phycisphaerales bacterium]|nr:hypothetical protein [Phycisphaerales bacterium]
MISSHRKKCLQWYLFAAAMAVSLLLVGIVVSIYYHSELNEFYNRADSSSMSEIELHETILHRELNEVASDIRFLADNPFMQQFLDNPQDDNLKLLESMWDRMICEKQTYEQKRLLDKNGMEKIRVEYNNKIPLRIPDDELMDKSDRYYFHAAAELRRGYIYVSKLDLNIENGIPEVPFKPTIRFCIGVYNSQNIRTGSLVINYNTQSYIDLLREASDQERADFMLVNEDGYWLMHPKREYEWGQYSQQNKDKNFAILYPQAWQKIQSQIKGKFTLNDQVYDFDTLDLQENYHFVSPRDSRLDSEIPINHSTLIKHIALLPTRVIAEYRTKIVKQCLIIFLIWVVLSLIPSWGIAAYFVGYVTQRAELSHHAHYDTVTCLANRVLFNERFEHALQMSQRYKRICGLLYIDLDGFKAINDQYGHHIGDELLATVAGRMLQCVRQTDTVARMGGDEFAIILTEIENKDDAISISEKLDAQLGVPVQTTKGIVNIAASIGVSVYPEDGVEANRLIELADKYMYKNKRDNKMRLRLDRSAS